MTSNVSTGEQFIAISNYRMYDTYETLFTYFRWKMVRNSMDDLVEIRLTLTVVSSLT